jgi:small-conductance mechanosensitive channel
MFELTTMNLVTDFITPERIGLAVRVILILGIGIPIVKLVLNLLNRLIKNKLSLQSEVLIVRTVKYVFYLILVVMVLNEFGFKISALLGAAGIFGLAIGFASQTSVSNIISGIFLISERPFLIGDVVEVAGKMGIIDSIDLLSIKLKTFDGLYVRIPNETMIKNDVTNLTRFDIRRAQFTVGVAYKEDIRKVLEILKDVAANMPEALAEPAPLIQLNGFGDSSVDINFGVWTVTSNVVNMKTELMIAVKERFDKEGIEIPFPHISIYAGAASDPIKVSTLTKEEQTHE